MKTQTTYIAWLIFLLALLTWAGVGLFAWTIQSDEADRELEAQTMQESESKDASAMRLHSLAQDTKEERAKLESIVGTDVVSIVNLIEETGKTAGVKVSVSSVIPETASSPTAEKIVATGFVIEAQGKFSSLMHVIQLLEVLPLPSTIGRLDMEYIPSKDAGVWGMNAYVRVLATEDASS